MQVKDRTGQKGSNRVVASRFRTERPHKRMQDSRDAGKKGCRTVGMKDRRDV